METYTVYTAHMNIYTLYYVVWQIKHRFRDEAMADDLDMSGLSLNGMPDVQAPTFSNIDQSNV